MTYCWRIYRRGGSSGFVCHGGVGDGVAGSESVQVPGRTKLSRDAVGAGCLSVT
jgi:hypothetical protein